MYINIVVNITLLVVKTLKKHQMICNFIIIPSLGTLRKRFVSYLKEHFIFNIKLKYVHSLTIMPRRDTICVIMAYDLYLKHSPPTAGY